MAKPEEGRPGPRSAPHPTCLNVPKEMGSAIQGEGLNLEMPLHSLCMCVRVRMYVCVLVCAYVCVRTCACVCMCVCPRVSLRMYVCVCACMCVHAVCVYCVRAYVCACMCVRVFAFMESFCLGKREAEEARLPVQTAGPGERPGPCCAQSPAGPVLRDPVSTA